jgi:hypothetical protein
MFVPAHGALTDSVKAKSDVWSLLDSQNVLDKVSFC